MRIAQVAPLAEAVPPRLYGGTERVVSWLTDELLALGHDVTLFASGDSTTRGTLVPVIPRALRLEKPRPEPFPAYAVMLDVLAKAASNFDIVHCHTDWLHLPLLTQIGVAHLTTIHNRLDTADLPRVIGRFPDAPLISSSDHHRTPLPSANWLGTVYHGLPADSLSPSYERGALPRASHAGKRSRGRYPPGACHGLPVAHGRQNSAAGKPLLQRAASAAH
jgi:glycosyltransferase involved in cell wall biosynthesis